MDPFLGQIILFGGNFAPRGWALCDGQLLSIAAHDSLFSLLGTTYGGDGRTTFGLPDLRGRTPVHPGQGLGLSPRRLGSRFGQEQVTLTEGQMPAHSHEVFCEAGQGTAGTPAGNFLGGDRAGADDLYAGQGISVMNLGMIKSTGGHGPHNNMQPSLGINYIIATMGTFPSR